MNKLFEFYKSPMFMKSGGSSGPEPLPESYDRLILAAQKGGIEALGELKEFLKAKGDSKLPGKESTYSLEALTTAYSMIIESPKQPDGGEKAFQNGFLIAAIAHEHLTVTGIEALQSNEIYIKKFQDLVQLPAQFQNAKPNGSTQSQEIARLHKTFNPALASLIGTALYQMPDLGNNRSVPKNLTIGKPLAAIDLEVSTASQAITKAVDAPAPTASSTTTAVKKAGVDDGIGASVASPPSSDGMSSVMASYSYNEAGKRQYEAKILGTEAAKRRKKEQEERAKELAEREKAERERKEREKAEREKRDKDSKKKDDKKDDKKGKSNKDKVSGGAGEDDDDASKSKDDTGEDSTGKGGGADSESWSSGYKYPRIITQDFLNKPLEGVNPKDSRENEMKILGCMLVNMGLPLSEIQKIERYVLASHLDSHKNKAYEALFQKARKINEENQSNVVGINDGIRRATEAYIQQAGLKQLARIDKKHVGKGWDNADTIREDGLERGFAMLAAGAGKDSWTKNILDAVTDDKDYTKDLTTRYKDSQDNGFNYKKRMEAFMTMAGIGIAGYIGAFFFPPLAVVGAVFLPLAVAGMVLTTAVAIIQGVLTLVKGLMNIVTGLVRGAVGLVMGIFGSLPALAWDLTFGALITAIRNIGRNKEDRIPYFAATTAMNKAHGMVQNGIQSIADRALNPAQYEKANKKSDAMFKSRDDADKAIDNLITRASTTERVTGAGVAKDVPAKGAGVTGKAAEPPAEPPAKKKTVDHTGMNARGESMDPVATRAMAAVTAELGRKYGGTGAPPPPPPSTPLSRTPTPSSNTDHKVKLAGVHEQLTAGGEMNPTDRLKAIKVAREAAKAASQGLSDADLLTAGAAPNERPSPPVVTSDRNAAKAVRSRGL